MLVAAAVICATAEFGVSLPLSPELREGVVWAATEFLLWVTISSANEILLCQVSVVEKTPAFCHKET